MTETGKNPDFLTLNFATKLQQLWLKNPQIWGNLKLQHLQQIAILLILSLLCEKIASPAPGTKNHKTL